MADANGVLHRRLSVFVDWIRTDSDKEGEVRTRAADVRKNIRAKAEDDGLIIQSTPNSGSFATRTGLRRHMRGQSEVEGQDVDCPFVVEPKTEDDERLDVLLPRFEKYARQAYPDTDREPTKSSVKLNFSDKVSFDLVPLLATKNPERQILIRANGERRPTSVQKHVDFVKTRTDRSNREPGRVKFNEMVRLLKWWRYFREAEAASVKEVPSFLMNVLSACAFDQRSVQPTYGETVADWFGLLARVARRRELVAFSDYGAAPTAEGGRPWSVFDPVNSDNNITGNWTGLMCDELTDWLEESRDAMYDAIAAFDNDRESEGVDHVVKVFGTPFRHHSEKTK
ncbi:MAG: CBASS oligonucleotide cyclase [Myxococcales bacterium]